MRKFIFILFIILQSCDMDKDVIITISTPYGEMKAILYDETPLHKENFIKLSESRTSIVVAHRLSTIKEVDKIIVIESGEIKEVGNHDQLLKKGGYYNKLYQMQYKNISN